MPCPRSVACRSASSSAPARSTKGTFPMKKISRPGGEGRSCRSDVRPIAHVVDVEVEQRPFVPDDRGRRRRARSRDGARDRRSTTSPARAPSFDHPRPRRAVDQQHDRDARRRAGRRSGAPNRARRATPPWRPRTRVRLNRQMWRSAATWTRPVTATSTIAASTGCGRFRSSPVRNSDDDERDERRDQPRERRPRAGRSR